MEVRPFDPGAPAPDHTAMPSANQELFVAAEGVETGVGPSCIFHPLYHTVPAQWTTSDPQNVTISSAQECNKRTRHLSGVDQIGLNRECDRHCLRVQANP